MVTKKERKAMTKADRKRMSSLHKQISKVRKERNQAMKKISNLQHKQNKLESRTYMVVARARAKARKR